MGDDRRGVVAIQAEPDASPVRKVIAYELLSLDGVAENPDGFFSAWDDAMESNLASVIGTQDAVILGRRSYDEWAAFWPGSEIEPFATFINGVTKYIATSTPLERPWEMRLRSTANWSTSCVIEGKPGRDIGIHASISVTQALLTAGVLDELRLVIAPAIGGGGRRLFEGVRRFGSNDPEHDFPTGHLLVDYRVIR